MALNLQQIREKLLAKQEQTDRSRNGTYSADNSVYLFWNNPEGSTATLRFLPDGDETNDFFWVERLMIKIPFVGVKNHADSKPVEVQVPCLDMWKPKTCPITAEINPWWKDESLVDMARKYYRKKTYLFQGLVTDNPNKNDVVPENPIRRFIITTQVYDIIKNILMDRDLEHTPTDYEHGRDFYLSKTTKGQGPNKHANYTTSKWAMKERALTPVDLDGIAKYGLNKLNTFLPKKPDEAHINAIMELFTASVNGELYDLERWGNYYKPGGMRSESGTSTDDGSDDSASNSASTAPATSSLSTASTILNRIATKQAETTQDPPWTESAASVSVDKPKAQTPDDIIAAIRRRHQQK